MVKLRIGKISLSSFHSDLLFIIFTPFLKMIDSDWVPYSDREEWADVTPIPQFENGAPIAPIDYSE